VESVSRDGSHFIIRGKGADLVTEVIQVLAERDIRAIDFRTELPTLEDVFLKVTGHTIRN
jgi:hypothetical protein